MNKNTVVLPGAQGEWGSYVSKYQPDSSKVLDNMFTANSKNFVTDQTGMIDKRQGGVTWNRTSFANVARDSYEAVFESGSRHFLRVGGGVLSASTGTGVFDTITSGYSTLGFFEWATAQNRVYGCNGINTPQVYDTITTYGGVTYSFTTGKTKDMGAQAPSSAPTAGTPTAGGSVPVGAHSYKVTFLYYDSEESNGSPSSATQTATAGFQTIPLTSIPVGGYGVTARKIYRDNNDGAYFHIATLSNNTATTFSDTIAVGSTPTPMPTDNGTPPTFSKIALWLDSLWVAPVGDTNALRYSLAGSPDIFPEDNFVQCQSDDTITAITVYNGKLYVHGLHSFGSIEGTTPDTFSYHNISNNIGCTDNRSIQIRSIVSVPTLWWLSDKGLYYSNGYTVEYGSDLIQDLVNLNLAQVNYSTNKNTQTSLADFSGDTYTQGIDISSQPGAVTTINPKAQYNQTSDWLGGTVKTNIKTSDSNFIEVPTLFNPSASSGTLSGQAQVSGSSITLSVHDPDESFGPASQPSSPSIIQGVQSGSPNQIFQVAQAIDPGRFGSRTLNNVTVYVAGNGGTSSYKVDVYSDSVGQPGSSLWSSGAQSVVNSSTFIAVSFSPSLSIFNGLRYWIVITGLSSTGTWVGATNGAYAGLGSIGSKANSFGNPSNWSTQGARLALSYTCSALSSSGSWTSTIYDSGAVSSVPDTISVSGTYPAGTTATVTVSTSASSGMGSPNTQVLVDPNGSYALTLTGLRYWQISINLSSSDDRFAPSVGSPTIKFSTTAIWVSQPIHATTDNTGWGTLIYAGNVPAGTSAVLQIATSTNNITYSSFGPLSGAAVTEWAKVQLVLTTDAGNTTSPSISDVTLTWNLTSTITSSAIDTGTTPAGFSTFQWEETDFGAGTVTAYIRTATTAPGLSAATYVAVTNGSFPNLTPLQFLQWKLVLTASADDSPVITSVTVNWFVGTGTPSVRCASLFYNKTYYLSVATIGSTANNVIIQLDQFGKWRIQRDNSVGTFLLYFNSLYFTDGGNGNIYNGFIADTDNGTAIAMDVRTKAWNERDDIFLKIPRGLKVTGLHTGTSIHAYYSNDRGISWIEMLNEQGMTGFQTDTDRSEFVVLFVPDASTLQSSRTLMYRIVSADAFPCSIINFEPSMYTRRARYLSNV